MLVIKNLSLIMSKDLRILIEDFSFSLQNGMKVALIGEEGNGKSSLLKAIADPISIRDYLEIEGEINKGDEIIGYLPQVLSENTLEETTDEYFKQKVDINHFDYSYYYELLSEMVFPEERISDTIRLRDLSGGEKIKFQLLCEMLNRPTLLLLDEPSNDLDLEAVHWLESFINNAKIPIMFVSHDESLLESCANTIIHFEQLRRKKKPQHTVAGLGYAEYVQNRDRHILRQTQLARKEKEEYDAKMERYRQIYQRVHHELNITKLDTVAKNLKDKMHSVKSMGKRFEREKENMTQRPDFEESVTVEFAESISIPNSKLILDLQLETLKVGDLVLSQDLKLSVFGPRKICIVGANGAGKTSLLRYVLKELKERGINFGYMPQDYSEAMDAGKNAIDFLSKTETKEEHTRVRTYLGSMKFTQEEMFHPVSDLSGGQRAKLYFSKLILDQAEVLVLDEPTRNISPLSGPEIRGALKSFSGCIIAVSHDRKFIREVFDEVLLLDQRGLRVVDQDYLGRK